MQVGVFQQLMSSDEAPLTASVSIVARRLGAPKTLELLAARSPEQALLDFTKWALCPFIGEE